MCKQLSGQEELLACDELKDVSLTADKLLYLHATELCLTAASSEFFGKAREVTEIREQKPSFSSRSSSALARTPKLKFSFIV